MDILLLALIIISWFVAAYTLFVIFKRSYSIIKVLNLIYDPSTKKLEFLIMNTSSGNYLIKSEFMLRRPVFLVPDSSWEILHKNGVKPVPMIPGRYENLREEYIHLAGDYFPIVAESGKTLKLQYPLKSDVELRTGDEIKVTMHYGNKEPLDNILSKNVQVKLKVLEEIDSIDYNTTRIIDEVENDLTQEIHPFLRKSALSKHLYLSKVPTDKSFKFKSDHNTLISELYTLEDLFKAIRNAPSGAIRFHMERKNDFATWVRDVIGDQELSKNLEEIKLADIEETRNKLSETVKKRILELG